MAEQADSLITVIAVRRSVARDCMVMEGAELIQYGCAVCNSTVPTTKYDTLISRSCRSVNAGLATKQNKHVLVAPTSKGAPDCRRKCIHMGNVLFKFQDSFKYYQNFARAIGARKKLIFLDKI